MKNAIDTKRRIDIKTAELNAFALSESEEKLLSEFQHEGPDTEVSGKVLEALHFITGKKLEVDGLTAKLVGEKGKADSLKLALEQYGNINEELNLPNGKNKKLGSVLLGCGIAAAVLGVLLGIAVMPALFVLAVLGAGAAVYGMTLAKKYKEDYAEYEKAKTVNEEKLKKKHETETALSETQKTIDDISRQTETIQLDIRNKEAVVNEWKDKWNNGSVPTEADIIRFTDTAKAYYAAKAKKKTYNEKAEEIYSLREQEKELIYKATQNFDEITELSPEDAVEYLQNAANEYNKLKKAHAAAMAKKKKLLAEYGFSEKELSGNESDKTAQLKKELKKLDSDIALNINSANEILEKIGMFAELSDYAEKLDKAADMFAVYKNYRQKLDESIQRKANRKKNTEETKAKLQKKLSVLNERFADLEFTERLDSVQKDIEDAKALKSDIGNKTNEYNALNTAYKKAENEVGAFTAKFNVTADDNNKMLDIITNAVDSFKKLNAQSETIKRQREGILKNIKDAETKLSSSGAQMRAEIEALESKRDKLRDEYTQKNDFIIRADRSLEKYEENLCRLNGLYDQKQKAQSNLQTLKQTIAFIEKAKGNLADRYLGKVEDTFNKYMHIWLESDVMQGVLDMDFKVSIEENGNTHTAEGYSAGYCDLIDFCMRLAFVDTLFESEQPFIILDDPFVNLDAERLERAMEIMNVMSVNRQIIYFVCHPIRVSSLSGKALPKETLDKLAEISKQNMKRFAENGIHKKQAAKKLPKEMYRITATKTPVVLHPLKENFVITNSIFSMRFVVDNEYYGNVNYELFFIDEIGHVLNERRTVEIKDGSLVSDRVQFSLNTRDDSGSKYELMVREEGQSGYDVVARIPFEAKLTFLGTDSFDF